MVMSNSFTLRAWLLPFATTCALRLLGPIELCDGQTVLWTRLDPNPAGLNTGHFGESLWLIKDCNGDGVDDVLVSDPRAQVNGIPYAGYVCILSGTTGATIHEWKGTFWGQQLSSPGAVGDVDGDGAGDLALYQFDAVAQSYYFGLISGATGQPLPTSPSAFFNDEYPLGDVNLDGFDDFATTTYGGFAVFAGPSGATLLYSHFVALSAWLGQPITLIDDLDGDGVRDLLVAAQGNYCYSGIPFTPVVGQCFVYSGASGALIHQLSGTSTCDYFGHAISPGDLNGDGVPDLIIDAAGLEQYYVYSGADWSLLSTHSCAGCPFGACQPSMTAIGDVNGDGIADYAITPHAAPIVTKIYSGADHSVLVSTPPYPPSSPNVAGWRLAAIGDANGDGVPDLVSGDPPGSGSLIGVVRCISLAPQGVIVQGMGCAEAGAPIPRIGADHAATHGGSFTINLSNVAPNECAALILGLSNTMFGPQQLPWELSGLGLPGCRLYTSMDAFITMLSVQIGPGKGAASYTTTIPPQYGPGVHFYAQWAIENPPGSALVVRMSRVMEVTIL